jgi:hypothetical protein
MENTKKAVSIEVLLEIMDAEEKKVFESIEKATIQLGCAKFKNDKKGITISKKEMKANIIRFHAISQFVFNVKTKGGIL